MNLAAYFNFGNMGEV